uniref:Somatostatin/Cortistatin C-terminal domain-containing protein n=1 Tax=Electrophorus electricus TaxID=8005 RepID=A0A4W4HH29_ELEEL
MRVLLSMVPVLLIAWCTVGTDALPVQGKLPCLGYQLLKFKLQIENVTIAQVLTKEQKDLLLKILSELAELNMTAKDLGALDLEQLLSGKLGERVVLGLPPVREKSPCKNFFWKTFSSC